MRVVWTCMYARKPVQVPSSAPDVDIPMAQSTCPAGAEVADTVGYVDESPAAPVPLQPAVAKASPATPADMGAGGVGGHLNALHRWAAQMSCPPRPPAWVLEAMRRSDGPLYAFAQLDGRVQQRLMQHPPARVEVVLRAMILLPFFWQDPNVLMDIVFAALDWLLLCLRLMRRTSAAACCWQSTPLQLPAWCDDGREGGGALWALANTMSAGRRLPSSM